jgi:endoglucanase
MMRRLSALAAVVALLTAIVALAPAAAPRPAGLDPAEWRLYQSRFITADGRVVDTGNGGISHSEGQGYAMLLAVAFDDPAEFARLWRWTERNLQVRDDHLFAWQWRPDAQTGEEIADRNSASDGDLLIAWALARAALRWGEKGYRAAARAIAEDVLAKLTLATAGRRILLPGPAGFVHDDVATVNLSYWIFPAFAELTLIAPAPAWQELSESGVALLREARFGPWRLPPDWLTLNRPLRPSPRFPPMFGYNAIRIPLHLVWGGIDDPALLGPFLDYATAHAPAPPPAAVDLISDQTSAERLSAGGQAILTLARGAADGAAEPLPALTDDLDYFASSLLLLAKLAHRERFAR